MTDISLKFLHPTDGRILDVTLDDSITAAEVILELIADDLQLKYEKQGKQLELEKIRSNDNFTATVLLLISQVVLSIGTNLLASNSSIAIMVMIAGILQTSLALYITFRKSKA